MRSAARHFSFAGFSLSLCLLSATPNAKACGGLVEVNGTVGMDAQRAFFAVHGGTTDLVLQVFVPSSPQSYGMVVPVPVQPTLDPMPVDSSELDALDSVTQPRLVMPSTGGGGIGCGGSTAAGGASASGVVIGESVTIGPVTATSLTADNGTALDAWLTQNGFSVPAASQQVVNGYAAPGHWFVAIKSSGIAAGGPSSIGVHLTMTGDQRSYALRMASVGAGSTVAFTVFVVAPVAAGPTDPYQAVTLDQLDLPTLQTTGYRAAVADAVGKRANRAWIAEGVYSTASVLSTGRLATFAQDSAQLSRLSTVLPASALTEDVSFTGSLPSSVPTTVALGNLSQGPSGPSVLWAPLSLTVLLLALRLLSRRLRSTPVPSATTSLSWGSHTHPLPGAAFTG